MKPSIGRNVHYVARGSADGVFPPVCRHAQITEVGPETPDNLALAAVEHWPQEAEFLVGLCVVNPTGLFFHPIAAGGCRWSPNNEPGTWHWPERVE
jgi:hypothetical protein